MAIRLHWKSIWGIVGACFFLFLTVTEARAAVYYENWTVTGSLSGGSSINADSSSNWMTGIGMIHTMTATTSGDIEWKVKVTRNPDDLTCTIIGRIWNLNQTTEAITGLLATSTQTWNCDDLDYGSSGDDTLIRLTFPFSDITLNDNTKYYFQATSFHEDGDATWLKFDHTGVNDPSDTNHYYRVSQAGTVTQTLDLYLLTEIQTIIGGVEVITLPDWNGTVTVGSEDDLDPQYKNFCFIGSTCLLWFGYGYQSIGLDVYLLPGDSIDPADSEYAAKELLAGQTLKDYFNLNDPAAPVTEEYCLFLDKPGTEIDKIYCDIEVEWMYDNFLADNFTECQIDPCFGEVASSTGTFDDLRYGVECGLRKVAQWLTCPSDESVIAFGRAYNALQNEFPMSVYNQFERTMATDNSTSTAYVLDISPIMGTDQYNVEISTSTMGGTIGTTWDRWRGYLGYFIYLLFFAYLFKRLFNKQEIEAVVQMAPK